MHEVSRHRPGETGAMASTAHITRPTRPTVPDPAPQAPPLLPASAEMAALTAIAERLHPADCTLLVRIIGRVAELERTRGEAAAMDRLETALARLHGAMGRA